MNSFALPKQLLWKDYRQLRPALVGCWAILAVILVMLCIRQLTAMGSVTFFNDSILLVFAAPTLVAMAASGILIGHERESRTWNWSSSLPIYWASSLVSKTIVWLGASIAMVATLLVLYLGLMMLCQLGGYREGPVPDWITPATVLSSTLIVPLIVFICFSWAALLWKDTLTAFFGAAIIVSLLFLLVSDLVPRWLLEPNSSGPLHRSAEILSYVLQVVLLMLLPAIFGIRAYRWRWSTGQLSTLSRSGSSAIPLSRFQRRVLWQGATSVGAPPSEFGMLFMHGLCTAWIARVLILLNTFALAFFVGLTQHRLDDGVAVIISLGAALLGVTAFSSDHTQMGYRFFADRGVHWHKLLLAHTLPPLVMAVVPALIVLIASIAAGARSQMSSPVLLFLGTLLFFLVGVFCSLCSRLSLLNICLTFCALVLAIIAMSILEDAWHILGSTLPQSVIVTVFLVEGLVVVAATILLLRRWLVRQRVWGAAYYLTTILVAILPANLLVCCFCFLSIPNTPWQGAPENQVKRVSQRPYLDFSTTAVNWPIQMENRIYTYDTGRLDDVVGYGFTILRSQFQTGESDMESSTEQAESTTPPRPNGVAWEKTLAAFAALEEDLDQAEPHATASPILLNILIQRTAWLAAYATEELQDVDLARRAWVVNRKLNAMVDYSAVDSVQVIDGRLVSLMLRSHLSRDDWTRLRSNASAEELQLKKESEETWSRLVKMQATAGRSKLSEMPYPLSSFPPVRWYHERRLANQLQNQLNVIAGRYQFLSNEYVRYQEFVPLDLMLRLERQLAGP